MVTELFFKLDRPARSKGGDRYKANLEGEDISFAIYIPQKISRAKGSPVAEIKVVFIPTFAGEDLP